MKYYIKGLCIGSERWFSLENFDGEVWKDIQGYEGFYQVSNYGRVKSVYRIIHFINKNGIKSQKSIKEKIKSQSDNGRGYCKVELCKNNKLVNKYVHILVAITFIPNPLNFPTINHKDEKKANNSVSNLEWCSYQYNNLYGTARQRTKKTRTENGLNRSIDMYDMNGVFLKHYDVGYHVEQDGLSRRGVYNVCTGRAKSYKGCIFVFHGDAFRKKTLDNYPHGMKKEVIVRDINGNVIKTYPSIKLAEKENGLSRNYLYSATYASTKRALINNMYFEIKKY